MLVIIKISCIIHHTFLLKMVNKNRVSIQAGRLDHWLGYGLMQTGIEW